VYVWSIARAFGGSVIVRIEDHDRTRSTLEYVESIRSDLRWLGLEGDNASLGLPSPLTQGDDAPYLTAIDLLESRGGIYPCRCSRRDIAAMSDGVLEPRYPGTCRDAVVALTDTTARRLRLPGQPVTFRDLRHGGQTQRPATQCGDLLIRDRHGHWTYHFAVVVDDIRHEVDLIIRGNDLLASTGRQLLLAAALDRPTAPLFLHHPLVTHPDGTKLSKARGDAGLAALRAAGWSAAAVLGHAAFLGGLQADAAPLPAAELARLWATRL
jgi:glutamyl-tRNA synthetase/glutamyl-Q tRNA(Asp) synthetase